MDGHTPARKRAPPPPKARRPRTPCARSRTIVRTCKNLHEATSLDTPLKRQFARLSGAKEGAVALQPALSEPAVPAVRMEERLRCRRSELQELQNLVANQLLSEESHMAEVKRVLEKETYPETGLSLLASLAVPLRQAGLRLEEKQAEALALRKRKAPPMEPPNTIRATSNVRVSWRVPQYL